jgi:apurinic endonuclease APN1
MHVSISAKGKDKGIQNAVANAVRKKCNGCFAIFTGSQRTWSPAGPTDKQIKAFKDECEKNGFDTRNVLPHSSYLINLGCPDKEKLNKSRNLFLTELRRCAQLGINMLNFHPGSTLNEITEEECCAKVAESLNWIHEQTDPVYDLSQVITVIECTAGQGKNIGYKFEHLKSIIDKVNNKARVGVCIDTCHAFAAGYDIRTYKGCDKVFADFERIVGFQYLKGMHLNDSKGALNCRTDRHENIGEGKIGKKCFEYIVNDKRFRNVPMVLETPAEKQDTEIDMLFSLVKA